MVISVWNNPIVKNPSKENTERMARGIKNLALIFTSLSPFVLKLIKVKKILAEYKQVKMIPINIKELRIKCFWFIKLKTMNSFE